MPKLPKSSKLKGLKKKRLILPLLWLVVSAVGVMALLLSTTPDEVGPLGITLFFLLVFVGLMSLGMVFRNLFVKGAGAGSQLFVILASVATVSALAIGTIELQVGDIILLALFVVTFSVYWTRLR